MPTLGIYGRGDKIVDPRQSEVLGRSASARVQMLDRSRHFPMLDEPDKFYAILRSFLTN
jgi:pimeloyl-ACP methyl ester carboxylesterase